MDLDRKNNLEFPVYGISSFVGNRDGEDAGAVKEVVGEFDDSSNPISALSRRNEYSAMPCSSSSTIVPE